MLAEVAPEAAARWLPALVTGEVVVTVALPGARYVEHAAAADVIVLADATGAVRVLERGDVALEEQPALDGAHRLHRIVRRREVEPVVSSAVAAVARAADRAVLYAAAESLGVGRRSLALSVAYAKDRHQFGRAIGSFQALKHRLADDWIALEFARPLVWRAAWAVARDLQDATLHVSAAKAAASDAAMRCARSAVQVHGAMGYTFECDVQLFLTRAQALGAAHGTARAHRRRIATVLRHRDIARVP